MESSVEIQTVYGKKIVFLEMHVNLVKYYFSNGLPQIGKREIGL